MIKRIVPPAPEAAWTDRVRQGLACLEKGGLALLPVDTVYGIAARADLPAAVKALKRWKGRGDDKPLAVLFPSLSLLQEHLEPPQPLQRLLTKLLPGPLTLVIGLREEQASSWPDWPGRSPRRRSTAPVRCGRRG